VAGNYFSSSGIRFLRQSILWAILKGLDFFDPLKISIEMANKIICPPKNNIQHFQNQWYISS
jgi:hypothetical protein